MPTYTIHTISGRLTNADRAALSEAVVGAHSEVTGAPAVFAQVIFSEIPHGHWYVGGGNAPNEQVFLYGRIRAGRTAEQKAKLLAALTEAVASNLEVDPVRVWVYLLDVPAENLLEYGRPLPPPGGEKEWVESLPPDAFPKPPVHGQ
jgi:phenylpyruvate tautomerase PptA (4-oxalocrotonate tautomerase family)